MTEPTSIPNPEMPVSDVPMPEVPAQPVERSWWERNRRALLALPFLALAAVLASSYRYQTLYRPNEYTQAQKASGQSVNFHEKFRYTGFDGQPRQYERNVTITLNSLKAASSSEGDKAVKGTVMWVANIQLAAAPDVPLEGCHVLLVDTQGRVYDAMNGKTEQNMKRIACVPENAPGPTFDFTGALNPPESPRPANWSFTSSIAVPEGVQPAFVRVAWQPPHYAQIRVP